MSGRICLSGEGDQSWHVYHETRTEDEEKGPVASTSAATKNPPISTSSRLSDSWRSNRDWAAGGFDNSNYVNRPRDEPEPLHYQYPDQQYRQQRSYSYLPTPSPSISISPPLPPPLMDGNWTDPPPRATPSRSPSNEGNSTPTFDQHTAGRPLPSAVLDKTMPFISILYFILSDPDHYRDCITWNERGSSFIVSQNNDRLVTTVLPQHFQHSNLQSFTRQLNIYEFTRMSTSQLLETLDLPSPDHASNYSGWSHPFFKRGWNEKLSEMKPRPSKSRRVKKEEKEKDKARKMTYGVGVQVGVDS